MGCASSVQAKKTYGAASPAVDEQPVTTTCHIPSGASLVDILGSSLLSKSGVVSTEEAIAGKGAVALYFSAHWCPPCRSFTPQLAQWYSKSLKAKGLEVIFVSGDHDAAAFRDYFKEMPWLAVPFYDRARERALSKKFKVQGIPSLVVLGPDGKVITKEGRAVVSKDPSGENFPWLPKSLNEVMAGATLLRKSGEKLNAEALVGRTYAFYFSAHWCPPCCGFTPKLAEWYSKDLNAKGLEIVFVSSDRDEAGFKEYFEEMPWLALDYSDRKRKEELSTTFGVRGIPSLVIIGPDGAIISKDGRERLSADPEGKEFPWYPKPVADLKDGPGSLEQIPSVIYFCEGSTGAAQQAALQVLQPLAQTYVDKQKQEGEEDPTCAFMIATQSGGLAQRLREMLHLSSDASVPRLMLLDLPDEGAYYEGPQGELTAESLVKFVSHFEAKALARKQIKRG